MPMMALGDLEIHYVQEGSGETLLLVPDHLHAAQAYDAEIAHFGQRFQVVSFDLPDSGRSSRGGLYPDEREYDLWGYWADLACHLLAELEITACHVIGTHGGALTALHIAGQQARQHGLTVHSLVADSFLPAYDARALHRMLDRREHYYTRQAGRLEAQHGDDWRAVVDADTAFLRRVADRGGYAVPGVVLNGVACPALLTGCLADPRTPGIAEAYARLAARIPACSLHLEARTGSPYIEYPWMWSNPVGFRAQAAAFWDTLEADGQ